MMAGSVRPSPSMSTQVGVPGPGRGSTGRKPKTTQRQALVCTRTPAVEGAVGHREGAIAGGDGRDGPDQRAGDPDLGEVAGPVEAEVRGEAVRVGPGAAGPGDVDVGALEGAAEGDDELRLAVLRDVAEGDGREPVGQAAGGGGGEPLADGAEVGWGEPRRGDGFQAAGAASTRPRR